MKTKQCFKCKERKPMTKFVQYKRGNRAGRYYPYCKTCSDINNNEWVKNHPWYNSYHYARQRCGENRAYYKKGIKFLMTLEDFKALWYRDKGWLLKRPSIDRVDPMGHYIFDNCRYIELSDNQKRPKGMCTP